MLTDNGAHFTTPGHTSSAAPDIKPAIENDEPLWAHDFELARAQNDNDHHVTKHRRSWTNGQLERMSRTLRDATNKRFHYDNENDPRRHLPGFVTADNFVGRRKIL